MEKINVMFSGLTPVQAKLLERMIILFSLEDYEARGRQVTHLEARFGQTSEVVRMKKEQNDVRERDIRVLMDQFQAQCSPALLCSVMA
jgi:hypothetical protein